MKKIIFICTLLVSPNLYAAWMTSESVEKVNVALASYCDRLYDSPLTYAGTDYYCSHAKINVVKITRSGQIVNAELNLKLKIDPVSSISSVDTSGSIERVKANVAGECRLTTAPQLSQLMKGSELNDGFKNTVKSCIEKSLCYASGNCPQE